MSKMNLNRVEMSEEKADERIRDFREVALGYTEEEARQEAERCIQCKKPKCEEAPSNLAVIGRYVFSPRIWALLEATPPGAGGEIQLTDAVENLLNLERVHAHYMTGRSYDCGSKLEYVKAFIAYATRHPQLKEQLQDLLHATERASQKAANFINKKYDDRIIEIKIKDQYYNMREAVEEHPEIIEIAIQAVKAVGLEPIIEPVRG
ncbi:MAG: hypothetical protein ACOC0J_02985, partial [Myxococcota bacterium]